MQKIRFTALSFSCVFLMFCSLSCFAQSAETTIAIPTAPLKETAREAIPIHAVGPQPSADIRNETEVYIDRKPERIGLVQRTEYSGNTTLYELENGAKMIVQENRLAPQVSLRCFATNAGSVWEGEDAGLGLSAEVARKIATLPLSAKVEKESVTFSLDGAAENRLELLRFFANRILDRKINDFSEPLTTTTTRGFERKTVQTLIEETLYPEHPLRVPEEGYEEPRGRVSAERLFEFYRRHFATDRLVFVVCGDVSRDEVIEFSRELFSLYPRFSAGNAVVANTRTQTISRTVVLEQPRKTVDSCYAWPTIGIAEKDRFALELLARIGETRIKRRLRTENVQQCRVANRFYRSCEGYFYVNVVTVPQEHAKIETKILEEIATLRQRPVEAEELARTKKRVQSESVFSRQTIARSAERLGENYLATGDPLHDETAFREMKNVTSEDIQRVAQHYLAAERTNKAMLYPIGHAPGKAASDTPTISNEIRTFKLPNGIRVLTKHQPQLPMVNIQAVVLSGNQLDTPQNAGRSTLLAAMLDQGTSRHTAEELTEAFGNIGTEMHIHTDRDTIRLSLDVLREDVSRGMELLSECLVSPSLPEVRYFAVQTRLQGALLRRKDDPMMTLEDYFAQSLPEMTPYSLPERGTLESITALKREDIRSFYQEAFVPNRIVVTVFGDVDTETARKLVTDTFRTMRTASQGRPISQERNNLFLQPIEGHLQTKHDRAAIMLGYPLGSLKNVRETAAVAILAELIEGELRQDFRDRGLSRRCGVHQWNGYAPGYFVLYAECEPENLNTVSSSLESCVEKMKSGLVAPRDFFAAKERRLTAENLGNSTLEEQASRAARDELFGLGPQYRANFLTSLAEVNQEEIISVARKYFSSRIRMSSSPLQNSKRP